MAAGLGNAVRTDRALAAVPAFFLSLVATIVSPFDCVLTGMVAAGLGIEAICDYLGFTRAVLDHNLVRLDLPTPHDRPQRKAGKRKGAWTVEQIRAAIQWRLAGVHPDNIGQYLGARSGNAVRSKLRRLGVPTPPRKKVHRVDPSQMPAVTDFSFPTPADHAHDVLTPAPVQHASPVTALPLPTAKAAQLTKTRGAASRRTPGQRELAILQNVNAARNSPASTAAVTSVACGSQVATALASSPSSRLPAPAIHSSVSASRTPPTPGQQKSLSQASTARSASEPRCITEINEDISWVSDLSNIIYHREAVMVIADLHFGLLHYRSAAERLGMEPSRLATIRNKIDIPLDPDRRKFGKIYDPDLARQNWEACGCTLIQEARKANGRRGHWFFRKRNSRDQFSLWTKRRVTNEIDGDEYRTFRPIAEFKTAPRSQAAVPNRPSAIEEAFHEKLGISPDTPPQRPGLPGHFSEPMPFAYHGHGRAAGGVAHP